MAGLRPTGTMEEIKPTANSYAAVIDSCGKAGEAEPTGLRKRAGPES